MIYCIEMNNYDFNGRPLRVDFADNEKAQMEKLAAASNPRTQASRTAPLPQAPPNAPSTVCVTPISIINPRVQPETVNSMLEGMNSSQLYEIVAKMKAMIQQNPEQAKQILMSNPPLTYALLQAQAILGMVNIQVVQKLLNTTKSPSGLMSTPPATVIPTTQPAAPNPYPTAMPIPTPFAAAPKATQVTSYPTPNIMFPGQPAPVAPQPNFGFATQFDTLPEQQKALLQQVVSLTQEQIDKLPPEQRQQVQQLRQTFMQLTGNARF